MRKDYLFYLSWILGIISIVLFHINMLSSGFGLLLFGGGLILIFFSKKRVWKKVLFIMLLLLVGIIGLVSGFIFQGNKAYDNIFISDNVTGRVRIIFSGNCGIIPNEVKSWYDININENLIIVKRPQESILYRSNYFLVNANGEKTKLKKIKNINEFNGQPSVIEYNPRYWKSNKASIHDFLIIKDKSTIIDNENVLDSLGYKLLLNCK